jgi:hypothetical protein
MIPPSIFHSRGNSATRISAGRQSALGSWMIRWAMIAKLEG